MTLYMAYRVSNEDARLEHCPTCAATPGNPCRKVLRRTGSSRGNPLNWVCNEGAGEQMKGVHIERGRQVRLKRRHLPASERDALTAWLTQYGEILLLDQEVAGMHASVLADNPG